MSSPNNASGAMQSLKGKATILIFGGVMALGIAIAVAVSAYSINKIRIGSATYEDIILVKDLAADVLPPPLYVIEAYLEASLALNQVKPLGDTQSRIVELRKQYDERWDYWKSSNVDEEIRNKLTVASHVHALKFWELMSQNLIPAIAQKNDVAARRAYGQLTESYQAHRAVVDEIVTASDAKQKAIEAAAASQVTLALWSIGAVDGALILLLVLGVLAAIKRLIAPLVMLGTGLNRLSEGDLTAHLTQKFPPEYQDLKNNFNAAAARLQATIGSIKQSAREVANAAAEISSGTSDLSHRTEQQATSIEETAASMEQISVTVKKNAENAKQAKDSASGTSSVANRGGEVVAMAVQAMAKIEESSRKIGDIIGVIDEIARQTNLLALNAAVEAARAGEAGRGFAVVATEVRSLAQRSSQAAKDIKDLIVNSNNQVKDGVDLVNRAGLALNEIVDAISKVTEIVSEIAFASGEQSAGLEQIRLALGQMDESTQQNSALVEENAATAKGLADRSMAVDEQVKFFKIEAMVNSENASDRPTVVMARSDARAAPHSMTTASGAGLSRKPAMRAAS
jgi:methyl-accepting chemotaxis protein